jgi:hypothetical protein
LNLSALLIKRRDYWAIAATEVDKKMAAIIRDIFFIFSKFIVNKNFS